MKKIALPLSLGIVLATSGMAQAACEASLADDIQPMFDANCVACHQDYAPGEDLSLQAGSTHSQTVNVASVQVADMSLIVPGNPDASYLYLKLLGTHGEVGGSGERMPFGGHLSDDDLALVANWIGECEAAE